MKTPFHGGAVPFLPASERFHPGPAPWVLAALMLSVAMAGCAGPDPAPRADASTIAHWRGGGLSLADLEAEIATARSPACRRRLGAEAGGGVEDLVECYREVARDLALEELLLEDEEDLDAAIEALGRPYHDSLLTALVRSYRERAFLEADPSDEMIEEHFRTHRENFRRPGGLSLWNIFRRHERPDEPGPTLELLGELKRRHAAGEAFGALAREYSHSETRLRDGLVGQISEGQLPAALEEVAFGLPEGGVSDPIPVAGGAVLLHVRVVTRGTDLKLDDVREAIRARLREDLVARSIEERVSGREPPAGSLVLEEKQVVESVGWKPERDVLVVGEFRLTAGELRRLVGSGAHPIDRALDEERRRCLVAAYERQRQLTLLAVDLIESSAAADVEIRTDALRRAREAGRSLLVERRIRAALEDRLDRDPALVEGYWGDNAHVYQTPLRFELEILEVPFGNDPPRQLAEMERVREELQAGRLDLEAAAAHLDGQVRALGWRAFGELEELPAKARAYIVQVAPGSYSVPFQEARVLHLVWVKGREEPRLQAWEEAREQVREDYLRRFERELYLELQEQRLEAVAFSFDETRLRERLTPPVAGSASPGRGSSRRGGTRPQLAG